MRIPWVLIITWLVAGSLPASEFLDLSSRWQSRDFYSAVYHFGADLDMGWTGSYQNGDAGEVSEEWLETTRVRINFFRSMAGVPADITFDPVKSAATQEAALMLSGNSFRFFPDDPGTLPEDPHNPEPHWIWYTENSAQAAQNSNLSFGSTGPDAIDGFIADPGSSNYVVGHRRWILFPHTEVMGSGDVPGNIASDFAPVNATWVIPSSLGPRPETREPYVAWPPKGYVPSTLVYPRWSFTYPNADFSGATVQMQSNGAGIPLSMESVVNGYGENTLVWVPDGMSTDERISWPSPMEDEVVTVTIGNVLIEGEPQGFSYDVIIYDPDKPGPGEMPTTLETTRSFYPGIPIKVQVNARPWSETAQGRILSAEPHTQTYGAEGDQLPFIAHISEGYQPVQSLRTAEGQKAFHLVIPDGNPQSLALIGEFLVTTETARLLFKSSLAYATAAQIARVEISPGASGDWIPVWSKKGLVEQNNAFTSEEISLSPWKDQVLEIRFRYEWDQSTSYFSNTEEFAGWAIDAISMEGVSTVTSTQEFTPEDGTDHVVVTFNDMSTVYLQAREFAFGGYPLGWGPVYQVQPQAYDQVEMTEGNWHDDPVFGWLFGYGGGWAYSHTFSWVNASYFPWIWTPVGWFHYLQGSTYSILWLYHQEHGYAYTESALGGWFKHEPFSESDWKKFQP